MDDEDAEDRVAHLLKIASKATARALQDRLAENGVTYGHWTFLRILWKHDGLSVTELSRRANVAKPATVNAVRTMEDLGYVRRVQRDGNLKSVFIELADNGRALEERLIPLALSVNDIALKGLDDRQVKSLKSMLARLIRNLSAPV